MWGMWVGKGLAPVRRAKMSGRERLEDLERIWHGQRGREEEEIVEELRDAPLHQLEERSIRELEVLARHELAERWGMDGYDRVQEPPTIVTAGRTAADQDEWRLYFSREDSPNPILRLWDSIPPLISFGTPDDGPPDTLRVEDVYHEEAHLLNSLPGGEGSRYASLEEYMYEEAIAMAGVLEKVENPSRYYAERSERLEQLVEASPMGHIDELLANRDGYETVLSYARNRFQDVDTDASTTDINREVKDISRELTELKREHGLKDPILEDLSVRKKFRDDIFFFETIFTRGYWKEEDGETQLHLSDFYHSYDVLQQAERVPRSWQVKLIEAIEDRGVDLRRSELSKKIDYTLVEDAAAVTEDVCDYLARAERGIEAMDRESLEAYRTYIIDREMEQFDIVGHTLGYEIGRRLHESPDYDAGEIARLPEEEAIERLKPLMSAVRDEYGLSLPLETEVKYYSLDGIEDRQHVLDFILDDGL